MEVILIVDIEINHNNTPHIAITEKMAPKSLWVRIQLSASLPMYSIVRAKCLLNHTTSCHQNSLRYNINCNFFWTVQLSMSSNTSLSLHTKALRTPLLQTFLKQYFFTIWAGAFWWLEWLKLVVVELSLNSATLAVLASQMIRISSTETYEKEVYEMAV